MGAMKQFWTLMVGTALALGACGGKQANTETPGGDPGAGGQAAPPTIACDQELTIACGEGATDGCLDGRTTAHVCVTIDAVATGGTPCEQEIALNCAQGQFDACLHTPAVAATHLCVFDAPPAQ